MTTPRTYPRWISALAVCAALAVPSRPCVAQSPSNYMNVESPQVRALELATVGSQRVLVACNTPDNTVEIWSTAATPQFLYRMPVGLEPVSVTVQGDRFWTANFLGDSVTAGQLVLVSTNPLVVRARVLATANVGDEPMDVAFHATSGTPNGTVFVTLQTESAVAWLDAGTLAAHVPATPKHVLERNTPVPPARHGLNEPRRVLVHDNRVYVLAFKGGVTHAESTHDLDVLSSAISPLQPLVFDAAVATLGSTNFSAEFDAHGRLWVAGGAARNFDNDSKDEVRDEPGGFVASMLYRVTNPAAVSPVVSRRNVNTSAPSVYVAKAAATAMPTDVAFHHVDGQLRKVFFTGFGSDRIGVLAPDTLPTPPAAPSTNIANWTRRTIAYPATPVGANSRWGPRSMVIGLNQANESRLYVLNRLDNSISVFDPQAEAHVVSFELFQDPTPNAVRNGQEFLYGAHLSGSGFVSCASCHTDGRTDALSWRLGNPGAPAVEPPPQALDIFHLGDVGVFDPNVSFYTAMFLVWQGSALSLRVPPTFDPEGPEDKREMVTQSLQGLSNSEVAFDAGSAPAHAELVRKLHHNAPFHWRGDKPSVRQFNEAFVTLLGGANVSGNPADVRGLTEPQMDAFERFVHSITVPPNPRQPRSRTYSESADPFDGAATGLELFHEGPLPGEGGRSCVHCHSLPEGSNNRLTIFSDVPAFPGYVSAANEQPIESAQLRGLLQKQPLIEPNGNVVNSDNTTIVGHFGLAHNGISIDSPTVDTTTPHTSINRFVDIFQNFTNDQRRALKQYVHEFDWGVAPMVGRVVQYVEPPGGGTPDANTLAEIRAMEDQTLFANAGVVIWVLRVTPQATAIRGFFLAAEHHFSSFTPYPYFEETENAAPASFGTLTDIANLLAPGDSMVVLAVPLGSERRLAKPGGGLAVFPPTVPSNITLLPMVTNTANAVVPSLRDNWIPSVAPTSVINGATALNFIGPPDPNPNSNATIDMPFAKTLRLFQYGLLDRALPAPGHPLQNTYGVSDLRHEAPRRLRVCGDGIQKGAKLLFSVPNPPPGYSGLPPSDPAAQPSFPVLTLELPLYATRHAILGNKRVWETAVELEPFWAYVLMLGGPNAPGVQQSTDYPIALGYNILGGALPPIPNPAQVLEPLNNGPAFQSPFDPDHWNRFKVQVRNPGSFGVDDPTGPVSTATWQILTMSEP